MKNKSNNKMNKKGLSEMISYVLLIIIAIGLASAVFIYLQVYVPKTQVGCSDDISLSIESYTCVYSSSEINLTLILNNKGLFTIDAVYIRLGEANRSVKQLINDPIKTKDTHNFYLSPGLPPPNNTAPTGLQPGKTSTRFYHPDSSIISKAGEYGIEIQPAVKEKTKLIACENAVISQKIICN